MAKLWRFIETHATVVGIFAMVAFVVVYTGLNLG